MFKQYIQMYCSPEELQTGSTSGAPVLVPFLLQLDRTARTCQQLFFEWRTQNRALKDAHWGRYD